MVKYIVQTNASLIKSLVRETVRTVNYKLEADQSTQPDYFDRRVDRIDKTLSKISTTQLKTQPTPILVYENYRKLFNRTLEKLYKDQVCTSNSLQESRDTFSSVSVPADRIEL